MDDQTSWDDEDLLRALERYREWLANRDLSAITIDSDLTYCGRFLRWRTGDYAPRACPPPSRRPVPAGKRALAELQGELEQYGAFLLCGVKPTAIPTYVGPPRRFLGYLGARRMSARSGAPRHSRRPAVANPSASPTGLADEYARIRDSHTEGIVRTVARMTLLPSVTRVFERKTAKALTDLLLSLPIDELPGLADENVYCHWFDAALGSVAATILELNPPDVRRSVHPGYKWGHGTKVLSLFVRNLVLCSRYFTEDEAHRIEPWLYCPIDGIVMDRLRRAGFDPKVTLIRQIDEAAFWRIQDALTLAARGAGVPRVWFDDVWSETRD
jgi:hypothetical protein